MPKETNTLDSKLAKSMPEFSRMGFRSVNFKGDIIAYEDDVVVFQLYGVNGIDQEKILSIYEESVGRIKLSPSSNGSDIELYGNGPNINDSFDQISELILSLDDSIPMLKDESLDIMVNMSEEYIFKNRDEVAIPENMIDVKMPNGESEVFHYEGWIDNMPSQFLMSYAMQIDCDTLNNNKTFLGKKEKTFDPFQAGYPSILIEMHLDEAIKLQYRANAKINNSLTGHPANLLESLCSGFEDYERTTIILNDILDKELPQTKDFETAIKVRERYAETVVYQMETIKRISMYYPGYNLVSRVMEWQLGNLEIIFNEVANKLLEQEDFEEDIADKVLFEYNMNDDDKEEQDDDDVYKDKYVNGSFDNEDKDTPNEDEVIREPMIPNPVLKYLKAGYAMVQDFTTTTTFLQNTPYADHFEIESEYDLDETEALVDRIKKFESIIELNRDALKIQKEMYIRQYVGSPTPITNRIVAKMKESEKNIEHYYPLLEKATELNQIITYEDPLCFTQPMSIKLLDKARIYGQKIMQESALEQNKIDYVQIQKNVHPKEEFYLNLIEEHMPLQK